VGGDVTRLAATNDQSNIYYFKKTNSGETDLTSQDYSRYASSSIVILNQPARLWYPCLVRTTLFTVLYEKDVCMKLFNIASPKFGEQGKTNWEARLPFT
jgi:hypothetical protein